MPIVWDALLTAAVAEELRGELGTGRRDGARLRAFTLDRDRRALVMWFRSATLVARLHPDEGALLLLDPAEPPDEVRNLAASLVAVQAPADDRLLHLYLRKVRGDRAGWIATLELMTNQWNAILTEGEERRIRHLLRTRRGSARPLVVGERYDPPPPSERAGVDGSLSEAEWREIVGDPDARGARGRLLSNVAWSSALNADVLLAPDGYDRWRSLVARVPGTGVGSREPGRGPRSIRSPEEGPVLLVGDGSLQPYPVPLPGVEHQPADTVLEAMRVRAGRSDTGLAAIPPRWIEALEERARSAQGRVHGLARELERASDPDAVRAVGDLILARYAEIERGEERVRLLDFEGEPVEVELDPTLAPDENAAAYYDRAARAERARDRLPGMLDEARAEAGRLERLLDRVKAGEAEPEEVRDEIPEPTGAGGATSRRDEASLPYRRYRSSGGLEIRVGRGPSRNDDLTFHHSRPDDVWLHARQAPGAHVILRWAKEENPPRRDLAEAATLAAVHSKAHTSGSVPVSWTRRKYVRKPRKAPPGAVVPDRDQTVFVEPDPELEERLRDPVG